MALFYVHHQTVCVRELTITVKGNGSKQMLVRAHARMQWRTCSTCTCTCACNTRLRGSYRYADNRCNARSYPNRHSSFSSSFLSLPLQMRGNLTMGLFKDKVCKHM